MVHDSSMPESFPRQKAITRNFRLGAPRAFRVHQAKSTVLFIRSESGRSPAGNLWCAQSSRSDSEGESWLERQLTRVDELVGGEIPEQERARRERMREVTEGITAYSVDEEFTSVAFVLNGELYWLSLPENSQSPLSSSTRCETGGGCIDPQVSPDGARIAYIQNNSLYVYDLASATARRMCGPQENEEDVTWGLADFAAAEELERTRGYWWRSDSQGLLVQRTDESAVEIAWISDPANPRNPARAHKYPFAGTANAHVHLFDIDLNGNAREITWDHEKFPYLVTVTTSGSLPTFSVLTRDQSTLQINSWDSVSVTSVATRVEQPWHTVFPGVPRLTKQGDLIEIRPMGNAFRLCVNGEPVSSADIQVNGLVDYTEDLIFTGSMDPTTQVIFSSKFGKLSSSTGLCSASADGNLLVRSVATLNSTETKYQLIRTDNPDLVLHDFVNNAETPGIHPVVHLESAGKNQLRTAIIWPEHHTPGTKLPVICAPYGGPHAQRVVQAGIAYCSDQWLANQGFAVVIIDNRGTPSRGPEFEYSIHRDLATKVLEDQIDALGELGSKYPDLDLRRVGIHGWSFGGYLAALAVLTRSDFFHAAVAGAPVTDWALYDTAYTERYLGTPQENPDAYAATSLLNKASGLNRPLLMIHGLADDNVLAANTLQLSGALLEAGKDHSVLPLTGVTHMTPQEVVAENLLLTELRFFQEHLGAV